MITPGELIPGAWFTLRPKPTRENDDEDATWSRHPAPAIGIFQPATPANGYASTALFCVEVVDYPLVWTRLLDGRHLLIDVEGYDLCEVKPELLAALQAHVRTGGASEPSAFDQLVKDTAETLANHKRAIEELKPKPPSKRRRLLEFTYWAGLAAVLLYASLKR